MDWMDIEYRRDIIKEIKGNENIQRKVFAYKLVSMQNDDFRQYLIEYLESKLDPETVNEMHIFSNVNLQRRISKAEAGVYRYETDRKFFLSDKEVEEFLEVYKDMDISGKLRSANEIYKYLEQCTIKITPQDGKLSAKVLFPYQYDVIPDPKNPEKAKAYIVSNFDNTDRDQIHRDTGVNDRHGHSQGDIYRDRNNQKIGDWDDPRRKKERLYVWTPEFNFVMNGAGEILDKETESTPSDDIFDIMSPLADYGIMPFVDVVGNDRQFEYWKVIGSSLYDATLMYNTILTSEFQTVEMQGHAQAVYRGSAEHMPENIRVGVDKVIHIPIDPQNPTDSSFEFANPGSDLAGIKDFRESFLKAFLSSRGLDVSVISGDSSTQTATSGFDRLLQMIEKFEASSDDFSLFQRVEHDVFKVIYHWIKTMYGEKVDGENVLKEKYQINLPDFEDASLSVEFGKPEMVKSNKELLEELEKEIEVGISSRVHALMEYKGMSYDEAVKRIREIDQLEGLIGTETNSDESERDQTELQS